MGTDVLGKVRLVALAALVTGLLLVPPGRAAAQEPDATTAATCMPTANGPVIYRAGRWFFADCVDRSRAVPVFVATGSFTYGGSPGEIPVLGDWDGNGSDTPGVFRHGTWFLRNSRTSGVADLVVGYGDPGDRPIVGNWDGAGGDGLGVVRGNTWFLRDSVTSGVAQTTFSYGDGGDVPVAGDWDGDGDDNPGVARVQPGSQFERMAFYIRYTNDTGTASLPPNTTQLGVPVIMRSLSADVLATDLNGRWTGRTSWYGDPAAPAAGFAFDFGDPGDVPLSYFDGL